MKKIFDWLKKVYKYKEKILIGWFLCLMAYQLFVGYLMPKPFS